MKKIKIEWCENFIKSLFSKKIPTGGGIEVNCFWKLAEASGLYVCGTYATPMTEALENLTTVETVKDANGDFTYNVFKLK